MENNMNKVRKINDHLYFVDINYRMIKKTNEELYEGWMRNDFSTLKPTRDTVKIFYNDPNNAGLVY